MLEKSYVNECCECVSSVVPVSGGLTHLAVLVLGEVVLRPHDHLVRAARGALLHHGNDGRDTLRGDNIIDGGQYSI